MDKALQLPLVRGLDVRTISIFTVWLFHLTSVVGVAIGYQDWFISKTPLNLVIIGLLVVINLPIDNARKLVASVLFFSVGMMVEWVGVHSGVLFGEYSYGSNLGLKLDGVPILIGLNWAVLTLITASMSNGLNAPKWVKAVLGTALMIFLDLFIEVAAPSLDYWEFANGVAPIQNYVMWFAVGLVLQLSYQYLRITGDLRFSFHLYAAQLVFFGFFYGIYGL